MAASAVAAGNDFFNTDASQSAAARRRPAVRHRDRAGRRHRRQHRAWYTGDDATDDPRSTALARADQSLTVSYGARANEQGLRVAVQSIAVFAAVSSPAPIPTGRRNTPR